MSRRAARGRSQVESTKVEGEDVVEDENDDFNADEEDEVTRCVCGNDELNTDGINSELQELLQSEYGIKIDVGLFIQCDKCSVWQHGYCVGLFIDEDVPDKYWGEVRIEHCTNLLMTNEKDCFSKHQLQKMGDLNRLLPNPNPLLCRLRWTLVTPVRIGIGILTHTMNN